MTNAYNLFAQLDNAVGNALRDKHSLSCEIRDDVRHDILSDEYIEMMDEWNKIRIEIAKFIQKALPDVCKEYSESFVVKHANKKM